MYKFPYRPEEASVSETKRCQIKNALPIVFKLFNYSEKLFWLNMILEGLVVNVLLGQNNNDVIIIILSKEKAKLYNWYGP